MATVSQGSTLYAGSVTGEVIYKIRAGVGFEWSDHVRTEAMMDGKPRQLTRGESGGTALQANVANPRQADFTAASLTTTIDGRQLNVTRISALQQIDVGDWFATFPDFQPTGSMVDLQVNDKIRSTVIDLTLNKIETEINAMHSSGSTLWNGFSTLILADGDATQVGTPAVLSSANIISYMFELRNALPPRLRRNKNLKIFMSYADADLFDQASRDTQDAQVTVSLDGVRTITQQNGSTIPVIAIEGIPKNFVFATIGGNSSDSNLVQGVWVDSDTSNLALYKEQPADETWNMVMKAALGVQYYTGKDIFYLNNV
jgi:hypothetical protein